ncbi:MAG: hypothetical protein L0229_05660 [Blastocatellia bacterium]|nr:hypothetical protein [Blastocatellia bacterium]
MKNKTVRAILFATISLSIFLSSSNYGLGFEGFPKGETIGQVFCRSNLKQSYALFLPTSYEENRKWPVLYCFDPFSQGRVPVEQFKEAAERYGYILVGMNNSKNGSFEKSLEALEAVWKDTQERLSIDEKRIYIAGFSGGARVASIVGSLCGGCVAGVIGCAAGFHLKFAPAKNMPFVYFGTIGTDDFNYPEMRSLEADLDKKRVVNRIEVFEGAHTWAPKDLCAKALGWMELQAIKRGLREKDEALIDALFNSDVEEAHNFEKNYDIYQAYLKYEAIAEDFKGLRDVAEFEKEAARLKKTSEVKEAIKKEGAEAQQQEVLEQEIIAIAEDYKKLDTQTVALGQLRKRIAEIRKNAARPNNDGKRRVARRALSHLFEEFYEVGSIVKANDYEMAVANLEIAMEINSNDKRAPYQLACAHATKGEKKKALAALRRAVENGFTNVAAIENSKELDSVREEDEYKKILASIKAK